MRRVADFDDIGAAFVIRRDGRYSYCFAETWRSVRRVIEGIEGKQIDL